MELQLLLGVGLEAQERKEIFAELKNSGLSNKLTVKATHISALSVVSENGLKVQSCLSSFKRKRSPTCIYSSGFQAYSPLLSTRSWALMSCITFETLCFKTHKSKLYISLHYSVWSCVSVKEPNVHKWGESPWPSDLISYWGSSYLYLGSAEGNPETRLLFQFLLCTQPIVMIPLMTQAGEFQEVSPDVRALWWHKAATDTLWPSLLCQQVILEGHFPVNTPLWIINYLQKESSDTDPDDWMMIYLCP